MDDPEEYGKIRATNKKARLWDIQVEIQKLQQEGAKLQQELQNAKFE